MEERETYLKMNRLDRYEKALREIARVEDGPTENKAVLMARETLTAEYLGPAFEEDKQFLAP